MTLPGLLSSLRWCSSLFAASSVGGDDGCSVQAKAAQTHVDLQQKEYAMQSAAKLMAQQLGGEDAVWEEKSVVVKIA